MSERSRKVDGLSPEQLQRLIEKLKPKGAAAESRQRIGRQPRDGSPLPLSFAQERLWFLHRLEPRSATLNMPAAVEMRGPLQPAALVAALVAVARRHESLRTTFTVVDGAPRQRIAPDTSITAPLIDLAGLPDERRQNEADRLAGAQAKQPFDLEHGPLLAVLLLRLGPELHHFLLVQHHVVSDGWSIGVLIRELAALYEACAAGRPSPLPELPIQYADFAIWQRRSLAATDGGQLAYWTAKLAGEIAPLDLPTDRPRPAFQTYRGDRCRLHLGPALAERLRAFAQAGRATPFMVLLAGVKALLHRYSGQDDILVGSPFAGRRLVETEGLIGIFLNTLVLRTDLSGAPSFRALLERVRETTLAAYSHQDVPFEALLARLQPDRDPSRTPFFQVLFNFLNFPVAEIQLPGLTLAPLSAGKAPSKFDMTFYVDDTESGIRFELVYNADLFDAARMSELLSQLEAFLTQALERPDEPMERLSLVTGSARALLPDPAAALDAGWVGAIHDLFAARARQAPERAAIADRDGSWTYAELAERVDRLAGWLVAQGVVKGDCVAVWAHRSAPVALAVLGALRAGAAFTMLDPAYPAARLVDILRIAAPRAFVRLEAAGAVPDAVDAWLSRAACPRFDLPRGGSAAALERLAGAPPVPAVAVGPNDAAVLGFTSGSTGTPKGIVGRHGPLTHFLPWQCERFGLSADDRVSLLSGLAHDPLQRDLFTPLFQGGTVVVPDPEDLGIPGRLAAWMAREGVTVAHLTPAMAQLLTEAPAGGAALTVPTLRRVLLVGDALTRLDVARIRRLAPNVTCVNLYGSTETQRAVAYHVVGEQEVPGAHAKQVLPLGRGMSDVQLLVINRAGLLAGIGEVGEIAVRSPHLARGYLGDETLTAAKFQVNPFTGTPGDRVYRTGDLGRYLPDGEVVFAGRADLQVKIRGFRIEPAEIEAVLASQPGVREAVVVVREERGEKRLVAYVVPEHPGELATAALRRSLRERLPVYMVPSAFVLLDRLPITPNGKVDRRALPAPTEAVEATRGGAPPAGGLEERVAAVWREVLGVEQVGALDNFFDLGGHSLLLVKLHARLQEVLGREIPLMDLFTYPNVRAQAEHLRKAGVAADREPDRRPAERRPHPEVGRRIAVIGMAGRFPGAGDLGELWANLRGGVDSISSFDDGELREAGVDPELLAAPRLLRSRGVLADVERFDAELFDCTPLQARLMDPQLRLLLECSWEALEDAGYDAARHAGAIGVYAGVSVSTYFLINLLSHPELLREVGGYELALVTDRDYVTTQVSYKLDLRGPSMNVQTACSTSLVAVHLACQALLAGECDMALAGGASVKVPQVGAHPYQEGGIDSPNGICRAFDAGADGTVWGSGAGMVLLKRLDDAIADGDTVHAVLLGTATNNDGSFKVGFTAPSPQAQAAVIAAAQANAGVDPATVTYVEAHGTGTPLGDPIEVTALTQAFGATDRAGTCALGSIKTNVGHLGAAAGVAGLIKTVLALRHREIPPSLHYEAPNPAIDFAKGPFFVNRELRTWEADGLARRAGVSSFGMGGTNVHAVLEEAPPAEPSGPSRPWQLLVLSARTPTALEASAQRLADWLEHRAAATPLADAAFTLQVGRRFFPHRRAVVCRDAEEARRALAGLSPELVLTARREAAARPPVAFLFPGQGAQHPGMGRGLYRSEPLFRTEVDAYAEHLIPQLGLDLRTLLDPAEAAEDQRGEAEAMLRDTRFAQPALFVVELALARLLQSWGVTPWAMLGHSLGEYVAACLAGVLTPEDALDLVAARGALMAGLPGGAMLSVDLPEGELALRLGPELSLAAVNGGGVCVASGPEAAIDDLAAHLAAEGIPSRRLHTSHAFHSAAMEPALAAFAERVRRVALRPPCLPYLSNLTGDWITTEQATDPEYWVRHLRETVRFGDGVARLLAEPGLVLLEVGPGRALSALAQRAATGQGAGTAGEIVAVATLRHPRETEADEAVLLQALGRLWLAGVEVDWRAFHGGERRRRVPLPTYPFQRRRHWLEPNQAMFAGMAAVARGDTRAVEEEEPAPKAVLSTATPLGEVEIRVAGLFQRLLGIDEVGRHDSFFALGGHSLLGTRLLTRIREEIGVGLSIEELFEAATPAALALRIEAARESLAPAEAPLVPVPREGELPLSFTQERLWFLAKLQPDSAAHNIPTPIRLEGPLDTAALERALNEVVRRHEALRTTFPSLDGRPALRIAPPAPFRLARLDLSGLPEAERESAAARATGETARQPFDIARGPLLRALLLRLAERDHLLLVTLHHIVADGWSLGVLARELGALYHAFTAGETSPLPQLPVQFADFAHWQRQRLSGPALEPLLVWWRDRLAGLPVLELPTDRPRPALESHRGDRRRFAVPRDLTAALAAAGQARGATLFMTLLAGFSALLARHSGQEDVAVGTPVAGRTHAEIEGLIGVFINTLVLRNDLVGDPAFGTLVERARETALGAFAHQEMPFEKLVEGLRPERRLGHSPLFQVLFILQNLPFESVAASDITLRPVDAHPGISRFDLTLSISEVAGGLAGYLEYKTELLESATVGRWLGHLTSLLGAAAADPSRRLSELSVLSESERRQLLYAWNDTAVPIPETCVHHLVAAAAARRPEAVAVTWEGESSTYRELGERASALARHLRAAGVGPEALVGVVMERSLDLLVAALAVWEAGGAYLPLDPSYPAERLAFMLQDSGAAVVLSQSRLAPFLSSLPAHGARILWTDREARPTDALPPLAADGGAHPESLAYVIYTSGSTGRPKGVQISHRALANFLLSMLREPGLGAGDVLLAVTSLSFDIAALELYLPLLAGARLEIASTDETGDGARLLARLGASGATVMQATPATWRMLLDAGWEEPVLRLALCGGEALSSDLAVRLRQRAHELWNVYGPTETTVWSTLMQVGEGDSANPTIPIGAPLANTVVFVLVAGMQPAPLGIPGEVCIGGAGVARGYLGRPDLTAERFVPDPFGSAPGERLYRTGDLARRRADGTLEFLGRIDHQVKLRGFRIELGEIEAVLARHPGVAQAVVAARPGRTGDPLLVAYLVFTGAAPAPDDLRTFMRQRLPDYMIPSVFTALDAFPLTPNGKVDRQALPVPRAEPDTATFVAPRTPIEHAVAGIWTAILRVDRVGAHDDFFALGGHSILATRLMFRLRQTFGIELPLSTLFTAPTLSALAAAVQARQTGEAASSGDELPTITPDPVASDLPFPLTDVQEAYWIGRSGAVELGSVSTHVYIETEHSELDLLRLQNALRRLIDQHGMLRAVVQPDGRQLILPAVPPYEIGMVDLSGVEDSEPGLLAVRERMSHRVLPSDRWPLFEIAATRRAGGLIRLHISLDLLIGDAWSFRILSRDLARLYLDPEATLAPLELSFRDYVLSLVAIRETDAYRRSLEHWRGRLASLPLGPQLPLAKSPAEIEQPRFTRRRAHLHRASWSALKERAARASLTPSGVLLAAFSEVLARWSGGPRLTLNLTLFNRLPLHPQVDDIVGDFTSLTLLAAEGDPGETFEQGARRLQTRLWEDLENRLVSGVQVLRELTRAQGGRPALMPVVFTSTLNQAEPQAPPRGDEPVPSEGRVVFSITQTPQVWLDHQVSDVAGELVFNWDAVEELFPAGLLDDLFAAYRDLLSRLAADAETWRSPAPVRLPAAQLRLIEEVNATSETILPSGLLHEPFLEQASRRPGAPAVITSRHTLTYGEIDRASLALAHRLRQLGARSDTLVAVVMEKGWEQVVAVLAVLRAGAAYLPIDAGLPGKRIRHLFARGEVAIALTQAEPAASFDWPADVARVIVDETALAAPAQAPLLAAQGPESLAYVIFTSGSTGEPKGVAVDHRAALNTIADVNRRFAVGTEDRVLALSSLSFDLSVYDVFGLLAAGGALVLPDAGTTRDPSHWDSLAARAGVTLWNSVPALMEMLVEYRAGTSGAVAPPLRAVLLSGDWIPVRLPDRIRAAFSGARVVSLGGATEASIWSILYPVEQVEPGWASIPYGRAMANQRFLVLDGALEPCPLWVPGRLYIGGVGLARGYWRDDEKTRAVFIDHPRTGERLYRTGDLGRLLPDGNIEFLGRDDTQVKVQGHRIELGEIEAALTSHPAVAAAAVTAVGERQGAKQLAAYVVLRPELSQPAAAPRVLTDPIERLRFKMRHPGLRRETARPVVVLPQPERDAAELEGFLRRRSYRRFLDEEIPLGDLAAFLSCLAQVDIEGSPFPKRRYGSAGNLYPVQTYLWVKPGKVEGLAAGIYYHDPQEHQLVHIAVGEGPEASLFDPVNRGVAMEAGLAVLLIARMAAVAPLYGEQARHFATLEAGLMTQLLEVEAPRHRIGLCQVGGLRFAAVRSLFALDDSHELMHTLLGGRLAPAQSGLAAFREEAAEYHALVGLLGPEEPGEVVLPPSVAARSEEDTLAGLREHLRSRLPEYMIPSHFARLAALPLSANGKVDRQALPIPQVDMRAAVASGSPAFVPPETELERLLAGILCEVLGISRVGVHDNFFDLGATSVHVVRVYNALRQATDREVTMVDMFNHPSIKLLAQHLAQTAGGEAPPAAPVTVERGERLREGKDWRRQRLQKRQQKS